MARPNSGARARRLIALLSRLEPDTRIPLAQLAGELGVTESEIAADLTTLSFCGVAPYDPFGLVPVLVDGDSVEVFGKVPALRGPVRLSVSEAEALAAALQAAGFGADEPLVAKLLAATTFDYPADEVERVVRASITGHDVNVYEELARAVAEHSVVEIEHASSHTGAVSCRSIEPRALFAERGAWYVTAWCRSAESWRTFRLDRIRNASIADEQFDAQLRPALPGDLTALDTSDLPLARLKFCDGESFSEREWPGAVVAGQNADGSLLLDVPYAGTSWIARRVVARLGAVEVVEPVELREAVQAVATAELELLG